MKTILCDRHLAESSFCLGATPRIVVVGTSGSGKSTLARRLAQALNLRDVELDALFWLADWKERPFDEFRTLIDAATRPDGGFVIHGNYNQVRDLTWARSDTLIWLDYPRLVVMYRVLVRTVKRILSKETLWNGNRETFRGAFLSRDSILVWAWKSYSKRRKQYRGLNDQNCFGIQQLLVLRRPGDVRHLMQWAGPASGDQG
jgi:adenylate kinase family enzyme